MEDRLITISTASTRKAVKWTSRSLLWSEFAASLAQPVRSKETFEEYMKMPKAEQDEIKDVGGFVGGELSGRRLAKDVKGRDLITLDLDNIPRGMTEELLQRVEDLSVAAAVYTTRKHCDRGPRLRVILPLDRTCTVEEYEPIARQVAAHLGMNLCDPTTFDINRLMYWPNACADGVYISRTYPGDMVSADGLLGMYKDWRNVEEWPIVPGADTANIRRAITQQQDPLTKDGIVGAFCRTYTIREAMEQLLPGTYVRTDQTDRFTFVEGSTTGGAIVYDDKFLYSHHATDPCSNQLVNAWDFVRLHKFGQLDKDAKQDDETKLPSYRKMIEFAMADAKTVARMHQEQHEKALAIFGVGENTPAPAPEELKWMESLAVDKKTGRILKTIENARIILNYDANVAGKIGYDDLLSAPVAMGALPWNASEARRRWTDADDAGIHSYLEQYGIPKTAADEALKLIQSRNVVNEVREYLESLEWDGVPRVETLLIDYLGAADNAYTRAVARKTLAAAAMRGIRGGGKFDYMPILTGPQGVGKSTFISILGGKWFSDSLTTFEGKDAAEMIQGTWINEVAELSALNRSEIASIKQFLTKTNDYYRPAYGKRSEDHPRRCVMIGSSNDDTYLKDATGNRRFWPIDILVDDPVCDVFTELAKDRDQVWAEAVQLWKRGEKLFLSGDALKLALEAQEGHRERDVREGKILAYLNTKVPENWSTMDLSARRFWLAKPEAERTGEILVDRDRICAAEIWCEVLQGDLKYIKRSDAQAINDILAHAPGWVKTQNTKWFGPEYGNQKGFVRG